MNHSTCCDHLEECDHEVANERLNTEWLDLNQLSASGGINSDTLFQIRVKEFAYFIY